jgi:hypothetical protein
MCVVNFFHNFVAGEVIGCILKEILYSLVKLIELLIDLIKWKVISYFYIENNITSSEKYFQKAKNSWDVTVNVRS